jgi:hypothetical protein
VVFEMMSGFRIEVCFCLVYQFYDIGWFVLCFICVVVYDCLLNAAGLECSLVVFVVGWRVCSFGFGFG